MTLADLIQQVDTLGDDLTIYVEANPRWLPESEAALGLNAEQTTQPLELGGAKLDYFLEVALAKEAIEVWKEWHNKQVPSANELCDAVIFYAMNDAYLPVGQVP